MWNSDQPWLPVCDATTTPEELTVTIDRLVAWRLAHFAEQLRDDEWPADMIARAVALARPLLHQQAHAVVESAMRRLRH
jgi:hypothetical protein